jgi:hypothetical protein
MELRQWEVLPYFWYKTYANVKMDLEKGGEEATHIRVLF